jgi:hypothetical protein
MNALATLALLLAPALAPTRAPGDEHDRIVRADGKEIPCRVLVETDAKIVYRAKGKTHELARAEVSEVRSVERALDEFLARFDAADLRAPEAVKDLALFADAHGLTGEAHCTWIRLLTLDPANEEAWTRLGGVKRRAGWELKVRGRFYSIDELRERAADWKNAMELPTAHFLLRTDAKPERALDLAIDLERTYLAFYDVLAPLELYVFDEQPEINVYADPGDYPAPPTPGRAAWFERNANVLHVNGSQAQESGAIVAELTDALVFNAFRRTLGKTSEIEPWAKNGLAFAFGAAVRTDPGHVRYDFSAPYLPSFEAQAADAKPLTLEQVLRAGFASFDSGSDAERYTHQAYTLVHFLAFHDGGRHRAGFADFLRRSYMGKGGTSNFFEALGADEKTLQADWTAYVQRVAGG